jgi:hypothetical protein
MTAALGWSLSRSAVLMRLFITEVVGGDAATEPMTVELQRHESADGGFTDVELRGINLHVVVEAKRGWALPSQDQLRRYEARFAAFGAASQIFVVLTQNGVDSIVRRRIGEVIPPTRVTHCTAPRI